MPGEITGATTLTAKGQIVLPSDVREKLALKAGQKFVVEAMSDGTILVIPVPEKPVELMELQDAERLEEALFEERTRDEKRASGDDKH